MSVHGQGWNYRLGMSRNACRAIEAGYIPLVALTEAEQEAMTEEAWETMEAHHVLVEDVTREVVMVEAEAVGRTPLSPADVRRHLGVEWDAKRLEYRLVWT